MDPEQQFFMVKYWETPFCRIHPAPVMKLLCEATQFARVLPRDTILLQICCISNAKLVT